MCVYVHARKARMQIPLNEKGSGFSLKYSFGHILAKCFMLTER